MLGIVAQSATSGEGVCNGACNGVCNGACLANDWSFVHNTKMQLSTPLYGMYGQSALAVADKMRLAGCNALWVHGFDENAFAGCEKAGLIPCVEFKTFRADFDEYPELIPIGVDGKPIRYGRLVQGVCLSNSAFIDEREEELSNGVRDYQPRGIWLDYLTYAGWFESPDPDLQESCFCDGCVRDFCEVTGIDADFPEEILESYPEEWTRHKCNRMASHGLRFSDIIKESHPECIIGAYMCPWTPDEYDGALSRIFAQDYRKFAEFIDVFTPLIYAQKSGRPPVWSRTFLEASRNFLPPGKEVQLILDVLDYPESLEALLDSKKKSWGYQIFGGAEIFRSDEHTEPLSRIMKLLL